jgi:hypothetical protein
LYVLRTGSLALNVDLDVDDLANALTSAPTSSVAAAAATAGYAPSCSLEPQVRLELVSAAFAAEP